MRRVLLALLVPCAASAASFDCKKAATRVEKAICADAQLSELDEHLGRFYFAARERLAENASCVAAEQREWIRRRNACADAACLRQAYLERLAGLAGWTREGDEIRKEFTRSGFPAAIAFVVQVGFLAEEMNHHPDIDIRWRTVHLALTTHDAGGLSTLDFDLAARIDEAAG